MGEYIGLDVSLKETAVSIRCDCQRIWRGKCVPDPQALAALIRKHAADAEKVVLPKTCFPPVERWRGTRPSQAAKSLAEMQIHAAILNRFTALGRPQTQRVA